MPYASQGGFYLDKRETAGSPPSTDGVRQFDGSGGSRARGACRPGATGVRDEPGSERTSVPGGSSLSYSGLSTTSPTPGFGKPEVVELVFAIGYQTFASQFAKAFQLPAQGFAR